MPPIEEIWTGRKLLDFLSQLSSKDLDKVVELEGCDCIGECGGVRVSQDYVRLERAYAA